MVWHTSSICVITACTRSLPATSIAMPSLSSLCHTHTHGPDLESEAPVTMAPLSSHLNHWGHPSCTILWMDALLRESLLSFWKSLRPTHSDNTAPVNLCPSGSPIGLCRPSCVHLPPPGAATFYFFCFCFHLFACLYSSPIRWFFWEVHHLVRLLIFPQLLASTQFLVRSIFCLVWFGFSLIGPFHIIYTGFESVILFPLPS